ncbi:chromophore lyase CpcT/CpeT [Cyanobium sp. Alchichica 3B3-8F6]|uniref:chromophore lyase CpcT/CpeT n=1 Tax=Synechococcales TaxID=1890424 RepID=UPI000B988DAC|nr:MULTISPECIES: chromophore lyase CpcT/CpeT [Synechococcales]MCP9882787.1 chromophore lyase CpcT/CpeT [Cyanobium sp. Alchichica 3B3-8F6]MCP9943387.1 chromophore lyase CpcT/CpeT [Cyanobium sp. ATX 6E8]
MESSLERLVRMLSGGFSNQEQAFENPPLYAHILVKFRPLPQLEPGSLLLEQSYAINPAAPYRTRVLRAERQGDQLIIRNQSLVDDQRFWGAVEDAERRSLIQAEDLRPLEGCAYVVREEGDGFVGEVEPGCRCLVDRKGTTSYLVSRLELHRDNMRTIDRGHDPVTHEHLWGSLPGPFEFTRTDDYSTEIPDSWREAFSR